MGGDGLQNPLNSCSGDLELLAWSSRPRNELQSVGDYWAICCATGFLSLQAIFLVNALALAGNAFMGIRRNFRVPFLAVFAGFALLLPFDPPLLCPLIQYILPH